MIGRQASILLPLFALRSRRDWGVGEIGAVGRFAVWVAAAGHRRIQLLPCFEMPPGERSPYGALSAAAMDPVYVSIDAVEDLQGEGSDGLSADERERLECLRSARTIAYDDVRGMKERALRAAFGRFARLELEAGSDRAREFDAFCAAEAWWLEPYAQYRQRRWAAGERSWTGWPSDAMAGRAGARAEVAFRKYVQWQAARQWGAARAEAARVGVALDGDLPFLVAADSADVCWEPELFDLEASVGVPPDAFAADGQDWGLPAPRWSRMAPTGFTWLRRRTRRMAALYDGFRIDHVVGYFRTWQRRTGEAGRFDPAEEAAQHAGGLEKLSAILDEAPSAVVTAEDLGLIPDFVRTALEQLELPGYRVLQWERDATGFRDPRRFPPRSVATFGTHDVAPLAVWWKNELDEAGRRALAALPIFASLQASDGRFTPLVHAALLDGLYGASSALTILPFQDVYGGNERVNVPGTVGTSNWSYRMPWCVEELDGGEPAAWALGLRERVRRTGRAGSDVPTM